MDNPLYPLPKEPSEAFLAFNIYCYIPKPERNLKTAWTHYYQLKNPALPVPNKISSKFHNWSQCFNWQERATTFDTWLLNQAIADNDLLNNKLNDLSNLVNYKTEFDTFFKKNFNILKTINNDLDNMTKDITKKTLYEKLGLYHQLSVTQKNLSAAAKINFESWGVLLGLENLIEKLKNY